MTLTDRKDRAAEEGEDLRLNSKGIHFNMEQKGGNKGNKLNAWGEGGGYKNIIQED